MFNSVYVDYVTANTIFGDYYEGHIFGMTEEQTEQIVNYLGSIIDSDTRNYAEIDEMSICEEATQPCYDIKFYLNSIVFNDTARFIEDHYGNMTVKSFVSMKNA